MCVPGQKDQDNLPYLIATKKWENLHIPKSSWIPVENRWYKGGWVLLGPPQWAMTRHKTSQECNMTSIAVSHLENKATSPNGMVPSPRGLVGVTTIHITLTDNVVRQACSMDDLVLLALFLPRRGVSPGINNADPSSCCFLWCLCAPEREISLTFSKDALNILD